MMKRKILAVLSLLLIFSLGWTAAAEAQEMTGDGTGRLWAKGAGYAQVHGHGVVDIAARGVVTVRVKGADVVRAQGNGRRWDLPDGTILFAGWRGHIHVGGQELDVRMLGGVIEFTAQGTGWALLKGRGHYRLNGQPGVWTQEGVRIAFSPVVKSE
jgi:uncharacterized membrane protein YgdD (TMEM256/DUF423 family)